MTRFIQPPWLLCGLAISATSLLKQTTTEKRKVKNAEFYRRLATSAAAECERKVVTIDFDKVPVRTTKTKQQDKNLPEKLLNCSQHIYCWGSRENLPYGFDGETNKTEEDEKEVRLTRGTTRPYLEDTGPQLDGHFKPHASRWFDTHQYGWKSLEIGSHFGAALTEDGDVYLWGSFIPPLVLGPYPILNSSETSSPTVTLILHQSTARVPTTFRRPTFPEQLAIDEAEERRVFVGPIKMQLNYKVKEVKVRNTKHRRKYVSLQTGVNKLFLLTKKGQVYCLDNLIDYLHWMAFDYFVVPSPPISNPYKTTHNAILDMNVNLHVEKARARRKRSLTSTLSGSSQEEEPLGLADMSEMIPSQVLLDASGDISIPPNYTEINNEPYPDIKVDWAKCPEPYLLKQLPQPGLFFGNGISTIEAGFDHLACLTDDGDLYCLGDNSCGQCGVESSLQPVVGINKVEYHSYVTPKAKIVAVSCGAHHTAFLDSQGTILTLGDDVKLQLGHGDTRQSVGVQLDPASNVSIEWNDKQSSPVQAVHGYALLEKHQTSTPTQIMKPPQLSPNVFGPPDMIECGALTTCLRYQTTPHWIPDIRTTEIHCSGENLWGQCGSNEPPCQQPFRTVRLPRQLECIRMSCGLRHCLGFLSSGELYGWGDNRHGQVGVLRPKKIPKPTLVHIEKRSKKQKLQERANNRVVNGSVADVDEDKGATKKSEDEKTKNASQEEPQKPKKKSSIKSYEKSGKPLFNMSPDYPGDVVHICCGFDSSAIIRNVTPNKVTVS